MFLYPLTFRSIFKDCLQDNPKLYKLRHKISLSFKLFKINLSLSNKQIIQEQLTVQLVSVIAYVM